MGAGCVKLYIYVHDYNNDVTFLMGTDWMDISQRPCELIYSDCGFLGVHCAYAFGARLCPLLIDDLLGAHSFILGLYFVRDCSVFDTQYSALVTRGK